MDNSSRDLSQTADAAAETRPHCKTCLHWDDIDLDLGVMGRCKRVRHSTAVRDEMQERENFWDLPYEESRRIEREGLAAQKAVAWDGSGYAAGLNTTADFGCVLHEYNAQPDERSETANPKQQAEYEPKVMVSPADAELIAEFMDRRGAADSNRFIDAYLRLHDAIKGRAE